MKEGSDKRTEGEKGTFSFSGTCDPAAQVNTRENVRLTFDQKVKQVIQEIVDSNFELYQRITDESAFGEAVENFLFDEYLRVHRIAGS